MNQRTIWNEHSNQIEECFQTAQELADEVKEQFHEYINILKDIQVLDTHRMNWNQNRFEIVVVGEFSTGKSTFINALLRKEVLPSKVTPTTATINYIRHVDHGDGQEKAVIHFRSGEKIETAFDQLEQYVTEMSKIHNVVEEIAYVDLFVESPYLLDGVVIVDTPGLQALHPEHERITKDQIKKSNASILLFNMEQPGKRSEFVFLKDLSDAIDRIFFVGNRMDGVPEKELDEVIASLEFALKNNDYQPVSQEHAVIYPMSALQALKAREPKVETRYWNDWSSEQLLEASRFLSFEERLEEYLFNGEKTKDLLKSPFQAIFHFYRVIEEKLEQIEVLILDEINAEQLQAEKERLSQEVELRKLQLQDKERTIKNLLQDMIHQHEKDFNDKRLHIQQHFLDQLEDIQFVEYLEEDVSVMMVDLNKEIERLVDQSLLDLSVYVEDAMRREMSDFELSIQRDTGLDSVKRITEREISVTKLVLKQTHPLEDIDEQFKEEERQLVEQRELLTQYLKIQQGLESAREKEKLITERQQSEERFLDMLLNNAGPTKKQYGVLKKRKFWWDKMGTIEVDNQRYYELTKERRELLTKQSKESVEMYEEMQGLKGELVQTQSEYHDMQDWYEAKRQLERRKSEERVKRIQEMTKSEARQLQRERKKVAREVENIFEEVRREYRTLLRGLDALKLAEASIQSYIQEKDHELKQKLNDLDAKERLLSENAGKKEEYRTKVNTVRQKIELKTEGLTNLYLQLF